MTVPGPGVHAPLHGDPGVQLHRTSLARHRTTLSTASVSLLLGVLALREGLWVLTVTAALLAVASVTVPLFHRPPHADDDVLHRWPMLAWTASLVIALALLGAVTAWFAACVHRAAG